jgi:hypothetical protein
MMRMTIGEIKTMQEAIELAAEIERMDAALKLLKSELKGFVDRNGAIETDDKVWNYTTAVSWDFGEQGLKDMAESIALEGLNPWELMTLSPASIKKLGWSEEVLLNFGQKKETQRFSSRKK